MSIKHIIKELKTKSFSGEDIETALDKKTKIFTYSDLSNFKNIDELLYPYNNAVILYETKKNYGHWVCVLKHANNTIEFYDPYGLFIDKQLEFIKKDFRIKSGQNEPILSVLLIDSPYKIIYNKTPVQKFENDISTCGRHVCFRLILQHLPLKKYLQLLESSDLSPDDLVSYFTAFI